MDKPSEAIDHAAKVVEIYRPCGDPRTAPAVKHDAGKPRTDLLPCDALLAVSAVLRYGAGEYGDRNWEKGMQWGRLWAALLRHGFSWARGETYDDESGLRHTAHMACCALMLLSHELRSIGIDDRGV